MFDALARRPRTFSQAAKILALLGWAISPLPGKAAAGDGACAMEDCTASCSVCGALAGLWAFQPAAGTRGQLGCDGLVGEWGAGLDQAPSNLYSISIAGGLAAAPAERGERPRQPSPAAAMSPRSSGAGASVALEEAPPVSRFGSLDSGPIFGVAAVQSECLGARRSPLPPRASSSTGAQAGRKRKRESSDAADVVAKVARVLAAERAEALSSAVEGRLRTAGVPLVAGQGDTSAFDPVLSHRCWCERARPPMLSTRRLGVE